MLLALNWTGWFLLVAAPVAAVFILAVPSARRGAVVWRLAIICTGFVLAAVAVHRAADIFFAPFLHNLFLNAFDVELHLVGQLPGMARSYAEARSASITAMRLLMVPIAAVLLCGVFGLLRFSAVRRWLYGGDDAFVSVTPQG